MSPSTIMFLEYVAVGSAAPALALTLMLWLKPHHEHRWLMLFATLIGAYAIFIFSGLNTYLSPDKIFTRVGAVLLVLAFWPLVAEALLRYIRRPR